MSYETAYSLETGDTFTALEANEKARRGILKEATNFQCSETCIFPLTCVNFKKNKTERIREPYFKEGGSGHTHSCDLQNNKTTSKNRTSRTQESDLITIKNNFKIKLNINSLTGFSLPKSTKKNTDNNTNVSTSKRTEKNKDNSGKRKKDEIPNIDSLSKLVSRYNSLEYDNKSTFLDIDNEETITLSDLFQNIDNNTFLESFETKVYYGEARVIERPNFFILRFTSYCHMKGLQDKSKPSLLIPKRHLINNSFCKKIQKYSASQNKFMLYFFGDITIDGKDNEFLNLNVNTHTNEFLANLYIK